MDYPWATYGVLVGYLYQELPDGFLPIATNELPLSYLGGTNELPMGYKWATYGR